ncbi:MAG TPA: substrate-binding domain-containing protein [Pyrinomonadaceae bacterium]|nr:substrate-binding domain-containing protein [Pyrinomonadaceae bacterium]
MRKILFLIALISMILTASCVNNPTNENVQTTKKTNGKVRIGFSMDTLKEHWVKDKELVEKRAAELGAEVIVNVAEGNDERQLKQVDDFLTQGIDVLIIVPHNAKVAATAVENAKKRGVPVVSYDRLILSDDIDVLVSHLHSLAGQMQAEYALKHAPKGNYVMIYGAPTDNNAQIMKEAQLQVLKPAIDRGDIKIVADQNAIDWSPENALKIAENALTQNENNIVAFVCSNDGTAGGAIQAIKKQNMINKVVTTGMDAQLDALQRIAQGEQNMTVYKPIKPIAFAAVEAAVKLAKGEKLDTTKTMKAVNKEVPFIFIEPKIVEKSNLMDIVRDGYESYDKIFANVPADQRPKNE